MDSTLVGRWLCRTSGLHVYCPHLFARKTTTRSADYRNPHSNQWAGRDPFEPNDILLRQRPQKRIKSASKAHQKREAYGPSFRQSMAALAGMGRPPKTLAQALSEPMRSSGDDYCAEHGVHHKPVHRHKTCVQFRKPFANSTGCCRT